MESNLAILLAKMIIIFGGVMGALAYTTLLERRMMAFVQMRPGPESRGPVRAASADCGRPEVSALRNRSSPRMPTSFCTTSLRSFR